VSQFNSSGIKLLASLALACTLFACGTTTTTVLNGDWARRSELDGNARGSAAGFVVNGKGYLMTGVDNDNNRLLDVWEYDPAANIWRDKSGLATRTPVPFPGVGRTGAVAFAIGNFGYVGTGVDNAGTRLADFYQYNPAANTWKKIADFPGSPRRDAVGFAVGNLGYVTTGFDGNQQKDSYAYDPATNVWTKVASFGGTKRTGAAAFVIGNKAYVGCGSSNGADQNDFWEFDPATGVWTERKNFTDTTIKRSFGIGFTVNGKGYFAGSTNKTVYEFDPAANTWTARTDFEGGNSSRPYAVGWSIGDKGYLLTGSIGTTRFDDIWSYTPNVEVNADNN
jgi:N-acetylneuraminic acid mutarotase